MSEKTEYQKETLEFIKKRIRMLNGTVLLITVVALILIVRFLYEAIAYMPTYSIVGLLAIMAGLAFIVYALSRTSSARAMEAIDAYSGKLNTLLMTSRDIHRIGYVDVLLEDIMSTGMRMTGAEGGSLFLMEGDHLAFKKVRGCKTEKLTGVSVWVSEHGAPVRIDDAENDSRFHAEVDRESGFCSRSVLCVPLQVGSGVIGALELVSLRKSAFTSEDEELLFYFADQAALAIVKAGFLEDKKNYEIHLTGILVDAVENLSQKRGHARRVTRYVLQMADAWSMPDDIKKRLYTASMLHDIGFLKIHIDENVSIQDYRSHAEIGYAMLRPINFYADILPIILHHHERYDGRGYPAGLKREAIPLESRMIAIAEAFDAMVSECSYKNVEAGRVGSEDVFPSVISLDKALEELQRHSGTQFDPTLVRIFKQTVREEDLEPDFPAAEKKAV